MKRRPFFYKFGDFLFLFLVLQIQFAIKGSNAVPGNSHPSSSSSPSEVVTLPQPSDNEEVPDFDLPTLFTDDLNEVVPEDTSDINVDNFDTGNADGELKISHVIPLRQTEIDLSCFESSPGSAAEELGYSMLRSTYLLRPKTHSRQSNSANSGGLTPGSDFEWVDENSVVSGSSRLAKILIKSVLEKELKPIRFDELCEYLEATSSMEMNESELMVTCKRIIIDNDNFVKTLKDLPLFINTHIENKNAIRINSILYSYLGHSGDEILGSDDEYEQGSGSSRCSKRGSDSTIESSPATSRTNSPNCKSPSCKSPPAPNFEDPERHVDEHVHMTILDEINIAQSHVPHVIETPLIHSDIFIKGRIRILPGNLMRPSYRAFPTFKYSSLYTLMEDVKESKQAAAAQATSEDDDCIKIEEID